MFPITLKYISFGTLDKIINIPIKKKIINKSIIFVDIPIIELIISIHNNLLKG